MDEQIRELVAMWASAAANCRPCIDHHLATCEELGTDREELIATVKIGLMLNRKAE